MPVLTRLYAPADFSVSQMFASISAILIVASALRYDIAIPLPKNRQTGFELLILGLCCVLIVTVVTALGAFFAGPALARRFHLEKLYELLPLVPVAVLLGGGYQAISMWMTRETHFGAIARNRVLQSSAMVGGQATMGAAGAGPLGLVLGQLLNHGVGAIGLIARAAYLRRAGLVWPSASRLRIIAHEYHRFPQYSVAESLANVAAIHIPMLMIGAFASGSELGHFTLAWLLLQMPMALVGSAIGQVYFSGAADADRNGGLHSYTMRTIKMVAMMSAGPLVIAALVSPYLFPLAFGAEWQRSGLLVSYMAMGCFLQLLVSPVSTLLHVRGQQKLAMGMQLMGATFNISTVMISVLLGLLNITEAFILSYSIYYAAYLIVIYSLSRKDPNAL